MTFDILDLEFLRYKIDEKCSAFYKLDLDLISILGTIGRLPRKFTLSSSWLINQFSSIIFSSSFLSGAYASIDACSNGVGNVYVGKVSNKDELLWSDSSLGSLGGVTISLIISLSTYSFFNKLMIFCIWS